MSSKTIAIVQARMSSTRLPGKVLKTLFNKPVLKHVTDRLLRSHYINQVIVATTHNSEDDILVKWCKGNNIECFRGHSEDVLSRFYECGKEYKANDIVRVTSDNPLVDPLIVDKTIDLFHNRGADYGANNLKKTFPHGLDVEVITFDILSDAHFKAKERFEREHVTQFVRHRPEQYRLCNLSSDGDWHRIRLTLDEDEDFQIIEVVMRLIGEDADFKSIKNLFTKYPLLYRINKSSRDRHKKYNTDQNIL